MSPAPSLYSKMYLIRIKNKVISDNREMLDKREGAG